MEIVLKKCRIILMALCFAVVTVNSALASESNMQERLFTFSNNNNGAVKEVNYYLAQGAVVKFLDTAAKTTDSTVIVTVVLQIPKDVQPYKN